MKKLFLLILFTQLVFSQDVNQVIIDAKVQLKAEKTVQGKAKRTADLAWYYAQVNIDSAKYYGLKSLDYSIKSKDNKLIAQSYNDLATVLYVKGDYKKSLEYCDASLKLRKKLKDEEGISSIHFKKGNNYARLAKYDSTMFYFFKAKNFYEKKGDSSVVANIDANISSTYFLMKNPKKAIEYLVEPINYYKRKKEYYLLANSTLNMGNIQLSLKDTINAIKSFDEAKGYANKSNNFSTLATIYNNLSTIYTAQNKYNLAIENIQKSIDLREQNGLESDLESSKLSLAINHFRSGDYTAAKGRFIKLKSFYEKNKINDKLKEIYLALSYIYAYEKQIDSVNYYNNKFTTIQDYIYEKQTLKSSQEIDVKYQTEKKEKEILLQRAQLAEKNLHMLFITFLLIISILLGYFLFNRQKNKTVQLEKENQLKDALLKIETQNRLQEQRLQISRDLHDNIGAQLTFIISSVDSLKHVYANQNPKLEEKLTTISSFTKDTIYELRDTIWAMNKEEITEDDLKIRISNFIDNAKASLQGIQFDFICNFNNHQLKPFSSRNGMNIYRIIQEAVNNAIKHANANKINVTMDVFDKTISFSILDNGKGFERSQIEEGNGLASMQKRAKEMGAEFSISNLDQGTKIAVILPNKSI